MKKTTLILLFLALLSLAFNTARTTYAQGNEPTGYKNVKLWIYPEYDDPRLLVMLEGQIEGTVPPAPVRFLVPSTAEMYSAGSMTPTYVGGPPHRDASSIPGWDEISYEVTSDTFRVEYYDPIIIGQPDKSISYDFRWLYPIAGLTAVVQVPKTASDFVVAPEGKTFTESGGFTAYRYDFPALDMTDTPLHFGISYHKTDTAPSLQAAAAGGGGGLSTTLLIVIAGIVAAAAAGGFLWLRRPHPATRAARRQASRKAERRPSGGQAPRFCTRCGRSLDGSPNFCPNCGKKIS